MTNKQSCAFFVTVLYARIHLDSHARWSELFDNATTNEELHKLI